MKLSIFLFFELVICLHVTAQSDVDTRIAINESVNPDLFVLIISNENYKYEQSVPYSINDGDIFRLYCEKTLGVPPKNIHYVKDATLNDMRMQIHWLKKIMEAYEGQARAIVYYSGHGMPDEEGKHSYLLPIDGNSTMPVSGVKTADFYRQLGEMPSKGTVVFMDACFSGTRRDGQMLSMSRGVAIKAKPETISGNVAVLSAAQGNETAYPYAEMRHGLFTYYILKHLQDKGGYTSISELNDYVTKQVRRMSIVENGKEQTPSVTISTSFHDWKNWTFATAQAKRYENNKPKQPEFKQTPRNAPSSTSQKPERLTQNSQPNSNPANTQKDETLKNFVTEICSLYGIILNETEMSEISNIYGVKQKKNDGDYVIKLKDETEFEDKEKNGIVHLISIDPRYVKKEFPYMGEVNWKSSFKDWNDWFTDKGFEEQKYEPYWAKQSMLVYVNEEYEVILMFDGRESKKGTWFSLIIVRKSSNVKGNGA